MKKVLISWMAKENDFDKESGAVRSNGPTCSIHQHHYQYDEHILLTSSKSSSEDIRYQHLVTYLRRSFGNQIVECAMGINDVIDLSEILAKVTSLLLKYRNSEITVFISPGTPSMQVAWYLSHYSLGLNMKLFQMRRPEHSENAIPKQIWVKMELSSYISSAIIRQDELDKKFPSAHIITGILKPIYAKAERIASTDQVRVLILGDTGTGKEQVARFIHDNSPRKQKAFIKVNCSAIGDNLLESRLFGYVKGAFTGADKNEDGIFHASDGGTVFLDEIGDISPYMQQSLLRFLQEGEIQRVGSSRPEKVNVRVLTATNRDLYAKSSNGSFRQDLYYRLSVCELIMPSLRSYPLSEKEEIFTHIWRKSVQILGKRAPKLPSPLKRTLIEHTYPGNFRELENTLLGIIAESSDIVRKENIPRRILQPIGTDSVKLEEVVKSHIKMVYLEYGENAVRTARALGVSVNTVKKKLGEAR
ncbi:MAG: sigma 54-interacting transcriptional regulator [Flavobacteriales bacterium]|nr:sigma 54-interacting transcriptional regulator [Flavobacteriales bacterium]